MTEGRLISLVSEDLLQDYVDGRLEPEMEQRVERLVFGDPDLRARALDYYALNNQLKKQQVRYESPEMPVSISRLAEQLTKEIGQDEPVRDAGGAASRRMFARVAAVCVVAVGAAFGGSYYWANTQDPGVNLAQLMSLPSNNGGKHAAGSPTTVSVPSDAALEGQTPAGTPELSPSFQDFGFELIETRVLKGADAGTVQLVYEAEAGERVLLYYSDQQDGQKTQVSVRQEGPLSMLFWQADGRAFTMLGEVDKATLIDLGRQVSEGLAVNDADASGGVRKMQDAIGDFGSEGQGDAPVPAKQEIKDGDGNGSI